MGSIPRRDSTEPFDYTQVRSLATLDKATFIKKRGRGV